MFLGVAAATLTALAGCTADKGGNRPAAAAERPAPVNRDPFPSTYRAYPSRPTALVGGTVLDGEGNSIAGGVVLLRARRFDEAIHDLQASLAPELHYETPEAALLNLADAFTETQRFDDAIRTLERGLLLRPRSGAIETALCRTYDRGQRPDDALRACQQAIQDEPTYAAGYFELGKLELRRGRNAEALDAFEKTLKLDPGGKRVLYHGDNISVGDLLLLFRQSTGFVDRKSGMGTITFDAGVGGWHSTGLYAAPGEVVEVRDASEGGLKEAFVQIGAHTDDLMNESQWSRCPRVVVKERFSRPVTRVASPFGGLIYVLARTTRGATGRTRLTT